MNNRLSLKEIFFIALMGVVLFLQFLAFQKSERFDQKLIKLEESLLSGAPASKQNFSSATDNTENEGDWLIWALAVEPKTLNLISTNSDIYTRWMCFQQVFEPLMAYDYDEIKLKPVLAESYEISADDLEITFKLRNDIHFSDGVPITADDVVFTYQTVINLLIDAADLASSYIDVKGVEKIDDRTVKFYMKQPYFLATEILSFWNIGIYPKHIYDFKNPEEFNKRTSNPVGSGPYVFEKWDGGDKVAFRRNENYWGAKPKIKKVVYKFMLNDRARLAALQSGDVDMIIPSPDQYVELVKDKNFAEKYNCLAYWNPGTPFYYLGWNQNTPFFAEKNVRLAMTYMLDRESLISHILKNSGKAITGPYYIYAPENDPNIKPLPYDVKKAGELLDAAGWKDSDGDGVRDKNGKPFKFKFSYAADNSIYQNIANYLKDSAAKLGIEVVADPVEWSVLITRLPEHKFDALIMGWGGAIIDDNYQIFHSSQINNRGCNYVGLNNPQTDKLLERIRRTLDDNERIALSRKLHRLVYDEQPYTFLFSRPTYKIVDRRFENVIIHKLGVKEEEWFVPKEKQKYK
ncbi:MAG: ABC transporter substrate-binding protein [Sedimentisphaerales bacterium]